MASSVQAVVDGLRVRRAARIDVPGAGRAGMHGSMVRGPVPSEPMYRVVNLAVGGSHPGSPDPATHFPATYAIDYVRVRPLAE